MSLTFFYQSLIVLLYIFAFLKLKQINTNMKTQLFKIFTLVALISFSSCKDSAKEAETKDAKEAAVAEATAIIYTVNTEKSIIEWKGFKPTGSHNGTIAIKDGKLDLNDGVIESGSFNIDMRSIVVTDLPIEDEGNGKLKGHLTSDDFFAVETHPTANFEVTGMETVEGKTMLSGNLTIKGNTNNISFPVTTDVKEDMMTLKSETFTIDRSKWNIEYGSKSFFDNLGDKFIKDDMEMKVTLTANKA